MNTIIVTGASSGIGLAVAHILCEKGYNVIGVGRSDVHCAEARQRILRDIPSGSIHFYTADLMQQREALRLSGELSEYLERECEGRLFALINNAGCARSWYTTTEDGYEQLFALNVLAPFLLTHQLMPFLINGKGRVIMTASGSHKGVKVHWGDVMLKNGYNPLTAYKQSKLCDVLIAKGINDKYAKYGVNAYAVDPGLVNTDIGNKQTGGLVNWFWSIRKRGGVSPELPAKTYAFLCDTASQTPTGLYYYLCKEESYSKQVTGANAERLFDLCEGLCGIEAGREAAV